MIREGARLASVEVNGEETSLDGKTVGEAASLIRGPVDTDLILTVVLRDAETPIKVRLRRAPLELIGVPDSSYKAYIGKPVPDLKLSSFDGKTTQTLSKHLGKIVVLDLWASWCPTCYGPVTKMQTIAESHPQWKGKVEFITVSIDSDLSRAVETIKENGWNQTQNVAADLDELRAIGVSVIPVAIVIRPDGTIANMAGSHSLDFEMEVMALFPDQIRTSTPVGK